MTERSPAWRRPVAMIALRGRLQLAIRLKKTDRYALEAARGWAGLAGFEGANFRTMKEALAWVETQIDDDNATDGDAPSRP